MKLWEIKAQALRIMFADTDLQFSEEEFSSGVLEDNPNTAELLVRMNDSIKRGIDLFYNYRGELTSIEEFNLATTVSGDTTEYHDYIDASVQANFQYPVRVDAKIYNSYTDPDTEEVTRTLALTKNQIDFTFDIMTTKIHFIDQGLETYGSDVTFRVWYRVKKLNLPDNPNQMTYDLDELYIPAEVQRMIPYFVKGELYEEDEPQEAFAARNIYTRFISNVKKPFSKVQKKIKRASVFEKTN